MRTLRAWIRVLSVVSALCLVHSEDEVARPNIIFIMADDMGWGEPGAFPSTSTHGKISTPNLDRFAKEGMLFRHAYAGYTVCAPSRTALFTGRHSGQYKKANKKVVLPAVRHERSEAVLHFVHPTLLEDWDLRRAHRTHQERNGGAPHMII